MKVPIASFFLAVFLATGFAYAEEKNYPGMKVWIGDNGRGAKKEKYAATTYWVQRNGSEDLGKKVKGDIYVRDEKAAQKASGQKGR